MRRRVKQFELSGQRRNTPIRLGAREVGFKCVQLISDGSQIADPSPGPRSAAALTGTARVDAFSRKKDPEGSSRLPAVVSSRAWLGKPHPKTMPIRPRRRVR
jgi:hypothetical protein